MARRILIVGQGKDCREADALKSAGYEIDYAESSDDAAKMQESRHYHGLLYFGEGLPGLAMRRKSVFGRQVRQLLKLLDSAPAGVVVYEGEYPFRVIAHNKTYQSWWPEPIRSKGLVGMSVEEYVPGAEQSGVLDVFKKVVDTRESMVLKEFYYDGMGRGPAWFNWNLSPVIVDGEVAALTLVAVDITDRKLVEQSLRESEQRYRTLADNISQLAWMADETGWLFWYNKRWYDYTGTTFEEMEGWGWRNVHHPDHVQRVIDTYTHSLSTGEFWEDTFPLRGKDGNYRWFLSRAVPVKDEAGKVIMWFGTNTDITELREAEEALLETEAHKREFYRNTIFAATDGKLVISEKEEILRMAGSPTAEWEVTSYKDLRNVRDVVTGYANQAEMDEQRVFDFLCAIVEMSTNALKHAGAAKASLHLSDRALLFVISDAGPGIGTMSLPNVALLRGYTTTGTLGMGYKFAVHFADRVFLATGPEGTTVAVEKTIKEKQQGENGLRRPSISAWTG